MSEYSCSAKNAWITKIDEISTLLDLVYTKTSGEIWLWNYDLKIFEQYNKAFKLLYRDRIDGFLADKIKSIKILLPEALYNEFLAVDLRSKLHQNLCSLSSNRLKTFYVGCMKDVGEPAELKGYHDPWIFYLGDRHLSSPSGVAILRPSVFPFSHTDAHDNMAIAWQLSDKSLYMIHNRLIKQWFEKVFIEDFEKNFKSLEPKMSTSTNPKGEREEKVTGYSLVKARSEAELNEITICVNDKGTPPIIPPVDCVIITALDEEFKAVIELFKLNEPKPSLAYGWHYLSSGKLSIVAVKCSETGSVVSAVTTTQILYDWAPKCVFLLGRCAGFPDPKKSQQEGDLQIGDVIISGGICAYEYQALKKGERGKIKTEFDARPVKISDDLRAAAEALIRKPWQYDGKLPSDWESTSKTRPPSIFQKFINCLLPRDWESTSKTRPPRASKGDFACGFKVVRVGNEWLKYIKDSVGKRHIIGVEMEGEGVGVATEKHRLHPEFLMIKGISDFGNPDKSDKYNDLSSETAAKFLFDLLSQPNIKLIISHESL